MMIFWGVSGLTPNTSNIFRPSTETFLVNPCQLHYDSCASFCELTYSFIMVIENKGIHLNKMNQYCITILIVKANNSC